MQSAEPGVEPALNGIDVYFDNAGGPWLTPCFRAST